MRNVSLERGRERCWRFCWSGLVADQGHLHDIGIAGDTEDIEQIEGDTEEIEGDTEDVEGDTEDVDDNTDRIDDLTGRIDNLTDRIDDFTDCIDDLTDRTLIVLKTLLMEVLLC